MLRDERLAERWLWQLGPIGRVLERDSGVDMRVDAAPKVGGVVKCHTREAGGERRPGSSNS